MVIVCNLFGIHLFPVTTRHNEARTYEGMDPLTQKLSCLRFTTNEPLVGRL